MLTYLLLGLVGVIAVLLVLVSMRPADYRIERATVVSAPPAVVMDLIEDFHQWKRWSPWDRMDPTQVVTIGGAPRGKGATYHWVGRKNGEGRMEIVEHQPETFAGIQLDFVKPFPSRSRCEFIVQPGREGTRVTWRMMGTNNFMAKAFDFFVDMDRMLGRDFERGLADLKLAAEGSTGARAGTLGAPGASSTTRA